MRRFEPRGRRIMSDVVAPSIATLHRFQPSFPSSHYSSVQHDLTTHAKVVDSPLGSCCREGFGGGGTGWQVVLRGYW